MLIPLVFLVFGFVLLVKGADWMVDGASSIARRIGVSDLFIGLTIVAFGTSTPELIVNIIASFQGSTDLAIGNIVGSNIANTLLILGATAVVSVIHVQSSTVRKEIPFSLLAGFVLLVMANDAWFDSTSTSLLSRGDGLVLLGFFVIFMYYTFGIAKNGQNNIDEVATQDRAVWLSVVMTIAGIVGLAVGGRLVVDGAVSLAQLLKISDALIGLTIVAIGTSLPELASSVVAAYKGKADIAVGNIVGSNIFNIFWILGVSAAIKPLPFQEELNIDLLVVIASIVLLLVVVHNGWMTRRVFLWWKQKSDFSIRKWEGATLLAGYVAYIVYIVWRQ